MKKFIAPLILLMFSASLQAQEKGSDVPKLVVGITIDQLRTDYIEMMQHLFDEGGFKRLMAEGAVYENVDFGYNNVNRASSVATIHTGTYPETHSVISTTQFDKKTREANAVFFDKSHLGNYTTETLSPKMLAVSTIADELKSATSGKARIYSVAPNADVAIIMAGHAGNAAFWLNDRNGKWATTTYYKELPSFVTEINSKHGVDTRIDEMVWSPKLKPHEYTGIPYNISEFSFKYFFEEEDQYLKLKQSPLINSEVTTVACAIINKGQLGKGNCPDMLNIGYYSGNYMGENVRDYSAELQDTYIRLDGELKKILQCVDKAVGLDNALIYITSTGYSKSEGRPYGMYGVPSGEFYPKRATALLKYYLMALYGHEDWVLGYHDNEIFLDRELIKKKELDYEDFVLACAEFMSQMEGVQDVLTSHQILHGDIDAVVSQRRRYNRFVSGDLVLEIKPGWEINYEEEDKEQEYVQYNAVPATLIFFGKNVTPTKVSQPIDATAVAPTICRAIRIRAPSASKSYPITLKKAE